MTMARCARAVWWVVLVAGLTYVLWPRLDDFVEGKAAPADVFVFGVWAALLLVPLFSEVSLLGVTLKREIKELRETVATQLGEIRTEVRTAVEVRTTLSQQVYMPAPVSDAQLPQIEERVKSAVADALAAHGGTKRLDTSPLEVSEDVEHLFAVRYNIEKELRRIARTRNADGALGQRRPPPSLQLVRALANAEVLEPSLANAIREVYALCSPAIHGELVSAPQIAFVRDVGQQLVAALRALA